MALDKQDLEYLKNSLEWLRDNTELKEHNRTNAESEWCAIFNSLNIVDRALAELPEREQVNELLPLVKASILQELNDVLVSCDKAISEVTLGSRSMTRYVGQKEGVIACINKVTQYLP